MRSAILVLLLAVTACQNHDLGSPCPALLPGEDPAQDSGNRTVTQETVVESVDFDCDEAVCVATAGRSGYCSRKCREDAGCPAGFSCKTIQPLGEFANDQFCVWKRCDKPADCGNVGDFCCVAVEGSAAGDDLKYCAFSTDGKCP